MLIKEITEINNENEKQTKLLFVEDDSKETEILLSGDGKIKVAASV